MRVWAQWSALDRLHFQAGDRSWNHERGDQAGGIGPDYDNALGKSLDIETDMYIYIYRYVQGWM